MQKLYRKYLIYRLLLVSALILLTVGFVFQFLYLNSSKHPFSVNKIEKIISQKEKNADAELEEISTVLNKNKEDDFQVLVYKHWENSYFIYKNGELVFWSNNEIEISPTFSNGNKWIFETTPNAYVLSKKIVLGNYTIVGYILLKHNYPYENNDLINSFAPDIKLNKKINISEGKNTDKFAILDNSGDNYLFTLQPPEQKIYNETYAVVAFLLFSIAFLMLFYIYAFFPFLLKRKSISWKSFFVVSISASLIVILLLMLDFPITFFRNNYFTSFHYASNTLLATLTHLAFFSFFVWATVTLFFTFVKEKISGKLLKLKKDILLLLPAIFYMVMFSLLEGLVFNSSTYLNIFKVDDLSVVAIVNHLILFIWGTSFYLLFIKILEIVKPGASVKWLVLREVIILCAVILCSTFIFEKYKLLAIVFYLLFLFVMSVYQFIPRLKTSFWFLVMYIASFVLFIEVSSIVMNTDKKLEQYMLLAENLYFNESSQDESFTKSMMTDLDKNLKGDSYFKQFAFNPDSIAELNNYLVKKYLRGFWNKYEVKLFAVTPHSATDKSYFDLMESKGNLISATHFYKINGANENISYLGYFPIVNNSNNDSIHLFMEFYPKANYKSYSYPNLLIESPPSIQTKLNLSVARYRNGVLVYSSGKFKYPRKDKWIHNSAKEFYTQDMADYRHYIYASGRNSYVVVSEGALPDFITYVIYFVYTFVIYILLWIFVDWLFMFFHTNRKIRFNLTSKLLFVFVSLMIVSFIAIFYVSISYTQNRYKDRQLTDIDLKKNYIQSALQEKYYWTQHLDSTLTNSLNFDLQDLSYIYQTDINVYDNYGVLIGTSQPMIFSKNLISNLISPKPYFLDNPNINQYESIGKLNYLATYSDFYNGDNMPIGYISIPHFLSKNEYNAEIQSFVVVILHISMIIILLFVFISIIIGRRLTAPLALIEDRLKEISLGKKNKKIDYRGNDEIGQLVAQYNKMVDELEHNAILLASSERESAWKLMARQVAHEINNPLTPMKLSIQQLQRTKKMNDSRFDAYFEKSTDTLIEQIENLSRIAGTFSTFARLPEPNMEKVDIAQKLSSTTQLFSNNNKDVKVTYNGDYKGIFTVTDKEQLIQVFNNLLKNAVQAIPEEKEGEITVKLSTNEKEVIITISDNGKGIPEEIRDKVFLPNFTTKSTGMGLGLAICKNIITASGGDISFESEINQGTTFKITLKKEE